MSFRLKKRRRAPRAPLSRPVQIRLAEREIVGRGIEVGIGGMSIWLEGPPDKGKMVTVTFSLPGVARRITAMSEVAWAKPAAPGKRNGRIGIRFVALPRDEREEIRTFVTRLARHYRDLHIMLAMNQWKLDRVKQLTEAAHIPAYRDVKELKERVKRAMDGFRL
jgi:Tfp pilus assembly protein PilZ